MKNGTDIYLVAYNALSSSRQEVLAIPVSSDATYEVHGLGNLTKAMKSVLLPSLSSESAQGSAPYMLHFASGMLPPLGAKVYRIRMVANSTSVVKPMVVPCMRKDTIKKRNRRPLSKLIPTKDGKRGFLVNRYIATICKIILLKAVDLFRSYVFLVDLDGRLF